MSVDYYMGQSRMASELEREAMGLRKTILYQRDIDLIRKGLRALNIVSRDTREQQLSAQLERELKDVQHLVEQEIKN